MMTLLQVLGALLIASPFVAVAAIAIHYIGWRPTAVVFGLTALTALVTLAGVYLMTGTL